MLQNLSSAIVMIGALRVNFGLNFQLHQFFVNAITNSGETVHLFDCTFRSCSPEPILLENNYQNLIC